MGHQAPSMCCCNTAPTAVSEASVVMVVSASGLGWWSRVALASISLLLLKAVLVSSSHVSVLAWFLGPASMEWRG